MTARDVEDVIHALRKVMNYYQRKHKGKGERPNLRESRLSK
jgi:hypothetical protein